MAAVTKPIVRPLPVPDPDTAPFWEGTKQHRLLIQHCSDCGAWRFPPSDLCYRCRSWNYEWEEVSGRGKVFSWVVVVHPVIKDLKEQVPYVVALVELEEGVRLPTNLVNVDPADVRADMPLKLTFQEIEGGFTLPVFEPDQG